MQLDEFKSIVLSADNKATKRIGVGKGNYTVWYPSGVSRVLSDDEDDELIQRIYVERFTQLDNDPIVKNIWNALNNNNVSFTYEQLYEIDTKYIHHIFTCRIQVDGI